MSAITAAAGSADPASAAKSLLDACSSRGGLRATVTDRGGAALGASRNSWEFSDTFSGSVTVLEEDHISVAADASLYYADDLRRRLDPEEVHGASSSHRIAAAFRRWGADLAAHLEGDFAFIVWDDKAETLVASRDFAGSRPLFWSEGPGWILLASTARALVADPRVTAELDPEMVAATAIGLLSDAGPRTCFRNVRWLQAGQTLVWHRDRGVSLRYHWTPPRFTKPTLSFEEATRELRHLLLEATRERMVSGGITGVSLSGGWDSPAVFGAAKEVQRGERPEDRVLPVSISYPEGDPGREDEWIEEIAGHWDAKIHWLRSGDIPILDEPVSGARVRDLPWAHIYENWNRKMPQTLSALDARVLLSGYGGDQLFQVSDIYLADLFWSGRWLSLAREWRAKGGVGVRRFFKWAIEPGLPRWGLGLIAKLRRKPLTPYIDRPIPDWFLSDFPGREALMTLEREHQPTRGVSTRVEAEAIWYLAESMFPRVNAGITTFALEADVEHRAPLYDRRIVAFAATRPWSDRTYGKETKRLLRAACAGLVPDSVLAPRPFRTGTTDGYARTSVADGMPSLLDALRAEPMRMVQMGLIDADDFDAACERLLSSPKTGLEHAVFLTAQTELWLRGLEAETA